jgi:hypothetical protein
MKRHKVWDMLRRAWWVWLCDACGNQEKKEAEE